MNVFSFTGYRAALKALVLERKKFESKFGFHALADAARIQRPYLSKVVKGTAQLSADQMYLIGKCLKLTAQESEYLQLLLESDRSSVASRKEELAQRAAAIAERFRDSSAHLQAKTIDVGASMENQVADYYLDPMIQIVHIAISIDSFSRRPAALAKELNISGSHLHSIIATLERIGFAKRQGDKLIPTEPMLHLSKSSPVYRAWRNQIKLLASSRINFLPEKEAYSFTTVFSGDEEARKVIHNLFLEFLKSCEKIVAKAPSRQVYQLSFDLFPWTDPVNGR